MFIKLNTCYTMFSLGVLSFLCVQILLMIILPSENTVEQQLLYLEYPLMLNPESLCLSWGMLDYIIYVMSEPSNIIARHNIRATWGRTDTIRTAKSRLVFVCGTDPHDEITQEALEAESDVYRDIIQADIIDSPRNLTIKSLTAMRWIMEYCPYTHYIIKTDDNIIINMFKVWELLTMHFFPAVNSTMLCNILLDVPITDNVKKMNKYTFLHGKATYPPFCDGKLLIFSPNLIPKIYHTTLHTPFFHIDDVYLTGYVAPQINNFRSVGFNQYYSWVSRSFGSHHPDTKSIAQHVIISTEGTDTQKVHLFNTAWKLICENNNNKNTSVHV